MSKRTGLVCQHLENVSRDALEEHQEMLRQYHRAPGDWVALDNLRK